MSDKSFDCVSFTFNSGCMTRLNDARIDGDLLSTSELLFCGAIAGMTGRLATAPIDRVRILYQVSADRQFTFSRAGKTLLVIARNTGVAGLWRGNAAAMVRLAPTSALSFTMFERYATMPFVTRICLSVVFGLLFALLCQNSRDSIFFFFFLL